MPVMSLVGVGNGLVVNQVLGGNRGRRTGSGAGIVVGSYLGSPEINATATPAAAASTTAPPAPAREHTNPEHVSIGCVCEDGKVGDLGSGQGPSGVRGSHEVVSLPEGQNGPDVPVGR